MQNCNGLIKKRCVRVICLKCKKVNDMMLQSEKIAKAMIGTTVQLNCKCGHESKVKVRKVD